MYQPLSNKKNDKITFQVLQDAEILLYIKLLEVSYFFIVFLFLFYAAVVYLKKVKTEMKYIHGKKADEANVYPPPPPQHTLISL